MNYRIKKKFTRTTGYQQKVVVRLSQRITINKLLYERNKRRNK